MSQNVNRYLMLPQGLPNAVSTSFTSMGSPLQSRVEGEIKVLHFLSPFGGAGGGFTFAK